MRLTDFKQIWAVDTEFHAPEGERPKPICLVAHELRSKKQIHLWEDELTRLRFPPYSIGRDSLFVAYYASSELGCHLSLKWPQPRYVLDLFTEFRVHTNGLRTPCGNGLLGALAYFGLNSISAVEKDEFRALAIRGGPFSSEEKIALVNYCAGDVDALEKLLSAMEPHIDLPRALLRGRYMNAAASMEFTGVPIDVNALNVLRQNWNSIQDRLIERIDKGYGVFDGRTFKVDRFEQWLNAHHIRWPRLKSGRLALDSDTFKDMSRAFPVVNPLKELRYSLSQLRLESLAIGSDGRNRTILSAFKSSTGRNQPSTSKFVFGPAVWIRNFIRPNPGYGLAYVDWEQQEFGIAARLSRDEKMLAAYSSTDPYLSLAKGVGAVPPEATKESHGVIRELYKQVELATQYGMESKSLSLRIGKSEAEAKALLLEHRRLYKKFWFWSECTVSYATLFKKLYTVFGWQIQLGAGSNTNPRSLRNFPMQSNGAEMLRLACSLATERGIQVCCPVHDAILIQSPLETLEEEVLRTRQAMAEASAAVLDGFVLRTDAKLVRWPNHYTDPRGETMWNLVAGMVGLGGPLIGDRCRTDVKVDLY